MRNFFATRVKELREGSGLSQIDLAKIFNVTRQTISAWEKGLQETDFSMLVKIADYFDGTY